MVARLGDVLFWFCSIVAAIFAALFIVAMVWGTGMRDPIGPMFLAAVALVAFGIGRACRYVLSGR
jgi:hypothetical protein